VTKPKPLTVSILGEDYMVACAPEEEDALRHSANFLDERMREIRGKGKVMSNERIAVMAALNISHELLNIQQNSGSSEEQLTKRVKALREKVEMALNMSNQLEL
jgi:cell division protein ZapA